MSKQATWVRSLAIAAMAALALTACGGQPAASATPAAATAAAAPTTAAAAPTEAAAEPTEAAAEPTEAAAEPTEAAADVSGDDPESRVKGFFAAISDAVNSPDIKDEAKRKEMSENIVSYITPDERATNQPTIDTMLTQLGAMDISQLTAGQNLDVKMHFTFNVAKTNLVEQTDDTAKVEMVEATMKIELTGKDVDKLGDTAKAVSKEQSIVSSDKAKNTVTLKKIDGVWYLSGIPGQ